MHFVEFLLNSLYCVWIQKYVLLSDLAGRADAERLRPLQETD
jgi:hypothetical protein